MTDLQEAAFTTSRLWEHIRIESDEILLPFHCVGDAEVNGPCCGPQSLDREAYELAVKAKSAARKVMDWLVNGDGGLNAALSPDGVQWSSSFSEADMSEFASELASEATAFMMTRKQLRAIRDSLIYGTPDNTPLLFGRVVLINDWIEDGDIWGMNLGSTGLHLVETLEGMRKEPEGKRVLWDIGIGWSSSSDVTCLRKA